MKKIILCIIGFLSFQSVPGQNLVLNPGIDSFITCPGFGQFSSTYINNWSKPSIASSDYYNYNCPSIQPTVQAPYAGEGYAGIIAYNFGTEYREYITGTLSSPLVGGATYNVEFYASLNNGYIQAIIELGAYLSVTAPGPFSNTLHINVVPQIENALIPLQDTAQWMKVSGSFVASGGEQFITIGNFNNDINTTISQPGTSGSFGAYYFIDEVSVTPAVSTSLPGLNSELQWHVFFEEEYIIVEVPVEMAGKFPFEFSGYNISGQKIAEFKITRNFERFPVNKMPPGIYFFSLSQKGEVISVKKAAKQQNK